MSILGIIISDEKTYDMLRTYTIQSGQCAGNEDVYAAIQGIRSLSVRLKHHQIQAMKLAQWLSKTPIVSEVIFPALKTHPQHHLWKRDFQGSSGVFCIYFIR
ncbi:PLP-dependent transferase [Fastidiosibacter lacustris]|uniref:PLP-dependent transferase n=1 Tax=Fastidiosibacter lacustris TaxID=2056695 RepID=UPI000E34FECB|nr:PLP-dependent transferase [Fastidiosibacter lacustris]